jgi:thiol-disulfide isomerase/thioredoxin
MARKIYLLAILFSITFAAISQQLTLDQLKGRWYATDGSNVLRLAIEDDFVLFESEIWDIVNYETNTLQLKNAERSIELVFENQGDINTLTFLGESDEISSKKSRSISKDFAHASSISDDFLKKDQVVLQGMIIPNGEMPVTMSVIYNDAFANDQKKFVSDVDEKGRFKIIFPLEIPQSIMISSGNAFTSILSKPGAKQGLIIDEASFSNLGSESWFVVKQLDFMGDLSLENEEHRLLNPEFMKVRDYFQNDSMVKSLDSDGYQSYRLGLMEKHMQFYTNYFDSVDVSQIIKDYSLRNTRINAADDLMRYTWMHGMKPGINKIEFLKVPQEYLDKVLSLIDNEVEEMMADRFPAVARELAMSPSSADRRKLMDLYITNVYEFLKTENLPDSSMAHLEIWKKIQGNRESPNIESVPEMTNLLTEYQEKVMPLFDKSMWYLLKQNLDKFNLLLRSSVVAVFIDQSYISSGNDIPEYILEDLDRLELEASIKDGILEDIADFEILKNKKFVTGVEISESTENILFQIKEKHKGKVVYVDVWATWCGPCISEFSYLKELKSQALEDVVFVYLCAQSSEEAFTTMVKKFELTGDNYFLNAKQYQVFDKEVEIAGFPTYLVITKEGKLVREGINRPSSGQTLVNQLKSFSKQEIDPE